MLVDTPMSGRAYGQRLILNSENNTRTDRWGGDYTVSVSVAATTLRDRHRFTSSSIDHAMMHRKMQHDCEWMQIA